jgi:hypothetical protein
MKWLWFSAAVLATSVVLVAALAALVVRPVGIALASTIGAGGPTSGAPWQGGAWRGGPWGNGAGFSLPSQLQGLADVPADQRFGHFVGVQLSLKDKDGKPVTVNVTPGTVSAASASSLTLAANDGTTKTYTLNDKTMVHGVSPLATPTSGTTSPTLTNGDNVVVVTLDNSTTATAVVDGGPHGFSWSASGGPWHPTGTEH